MRQLVFVLKNRLQGENYGTYGQAEKRWESRGHFTFYHRSHLNGFCFFRRRDLAMDGRIDRGDIYPDCDIWILTLKRDHAEGLQQKG